MPTMPSRDEQQPLYVLGRDYASDDGAIVDAGCFLGGSTAALLAGDAFEWTTVDRDRERRGNEDRQGEEDESELPEPDPAKRPPQVIAESKNTQSSVEPMARPRDSQVAKLRQALPCLELADQRLLAGTRAYPRSE